MNFFLIIFFFSTSVFALEKKTVAEYIVAGPGITVESLKITLKKYPPEHVKPLSKGNYLIQYKKDPGLSALKAAGGKGLVIQSNFIYKSLK